MEPWRPRRGLVNEVFHVNHCQGRITGLMVNGVFHVNQSAWPGCWMAIWPD